MNKSTILGIFALLRSRREKGKKKGLENRMKICAVPTQQKLEAKNEA
jgi:hypothetical protein